MIPNFLNKQEQIKLPVGGDFAPTGFVGQWYAALVYSFLAELDESIVRSEGVEPAAVKQGGWSRYYFKTYAECQAAIEKLDIRDQRGNVRRPDQEWRYEAPLPSIINMSEQGRAKFNDPVSFSVRISTLRSNKYRHELHMISLPCAVAAMADAYGYESPGFSVDELLSQDTVFTDDFQAATVGGEGFDGKVPYTESKLWGQRAALWAALGEKDAKAYRPTGADGKYVTASEKLSNCLGILAYPWTQAIWARLMMVPDPRVDAVYTGADGESKRLSVAAITQIFADEAAARAVVEKEQATFAGDSAGESVTPAPPSKAVPEVYAEWPDMFKQKVAAFKAAGGADGSPPAVMDKIRKHSDFTGIEPAEVMAWL